MKSNFMIQAEIDIAAHPEWSEYEKMICKRRAYLKGLRLEPKDFKFFDAFTHFPYKPQSILFDSDYEVEWQPIRYQQEFLSKIWRGDML